MRPLDRVPASPGHSTTPNDGPRFRRQHGLSRYALALVVLMLPVTAWSGSSTMGQNSAESDPVVDQAGVATSPGTNRTMDATRPASGETNRTGGDPELATSHMYDLALGKAVFNRTCLTCHGNSVLDAPRVGDMHVWQPRLAQGLDVLIDHALKGHGRMPAKGGYRSLTDYEVGSAVSYVYQVGTGILERQETTEGHTGCDPASNLDQCTPEELKRLLVLQMLWLLGGTHQ